MSLCLYVSVLPEEGRGDRNIASKSCHILSVRKLTKSAGFVDPRVQHIYSVHHCRVLYNQATVAALHFNENSGRDQAVTKEGKERYNILFPKFKKGGYIVRKLTVQPTYSKL